MSLFLCWYTFSKKEIFFTEGPYHCVLTIKTLVISDVYMCLKNGILELFIAL